MGWQSQGGPNNKRDGTTMEVKILTSSPSASAAFDLRCAIREHMISFIQKNYPDALPRMRAEILENSRNVCLSPGSSGEQDLTC